MIEREIYHRRKIALLDRDGTIIQKIHYLSDPNDVKIIAYTLLRYLQDHDYALVMITNQSIIGRGIAHICRVEEVNRTVMRKYHEQAQARVAACRECINDTGSVQVCAYRRFRVRRGSRSGIRNLYQYPDSDRSTMACDGKARST